MQPKVKTLQERMGFRDDELSTPRHDEIMMWLDGNVERLLGIYKPWDQARVEQVRMESRAGAERARRDAISLLREKRRGDIYTSMTEAPIDKRAQLRHALESEIQAINIPREEMENILSADPPPRNVKVKKIWEMPVLSGSYTVGFVDMEIASTDPELYATGYPPKWGQYPGEWVNCFIEVKSKIDSLGEVIRQIRFYQTHCRGKFYVCCPDSRFERQLAAQGIGFIEAEV